MSYSLLTHIIARECNLDVGEFGHTIIDAHIYSNHVEQCREQLTRDPLPLPKLIIDDDFDLVDGLDNGFRLDSKSKFRLEGYQCHPKITAPMAI